MFNEYPDIVTIDQLCEMLCIGKNSAYTLVSSGQIKAFRHNRTWKIPKLTIIEYVLAKSSISNS